MPELFKKLETEQVITISEALGDAFTPDEMEVFLSKCQRPMLYKAYSREGATHRKIAKNLIKKLNRDGDIKVYLHMVFQSLRDDPIERLNKASFLSVLEEIYPNLKSWSPHPEIYASSLAGFLKTLDDNLSDADREALKSVQKELNQHFETFLSGVDEITFYKKTHDIFHELDTKWSGKAALLAANSAKADAFGQLTQFKQDLVNTSSKAPDLLSLISSAGEGLIELLKSLFKVISDFLTGFISTDLLPEDETELMMFHVSAEKYQTHLVDNLRKLNALISKAAEQLDFSNLAQALKKYGTALPADHQAKPDFMENIEWIQGKFGVALQDLVKLHSTWQEVLWPISAIEGALRVEFGRSIGTAPLLWNPVRMELEPLYDQFVEEPKRATLLSYMVDLDHLFSKHIDLTEDEFEHLKLKFTICKSAASQHFLSVDRSLLQECETMAGLRGNITKFIEA